MGTTASLGGDAPIDGWCAPGYEGVRRAFADNFAEQGEVGAAVCVVVDGEIVVDLVGGWTDADQTRPWDPETIVDFYSVGKAVVGLLALQLVDEGLIGLDDPIAEVWPEFGVGGKETATVRHALSHQAGVPAIRQPLSNDDLWHWDRMVDALAATEAWWVPGSRHAYHTNTYGHLVGEIVRRVSGQMPGSAFGASPSHWKPTSGSACPTASSIAAPTSSGPGPRRRTRTSSARSRAMH